jgi:transposase InsO family protein
MDRGLFGASLLVSGGAAQRGARKDRMKELSPKDHGEAVAQYRSEIIGALTRRELGRGELGRELEELAKKRFRAPRSHGSRCYSVATLERWYYAYKQGGAEALRPHSRADRGRGRELSEEQRALLCSIRKEHPSASVPLIVRTLTAEGRLDEGAVSETTVRRLFAEKGLDRASLRHGHGGKQRLRWQAEHPGALWHGDVCHGAPLVLGEHRTTVRIHALLDDASRYVVALEAMAQEREVDMLALLVRAVRRHGPPDALYLDNGSTYRGQTLSLACGRMGTTLIHAQPYDAPARGKMERFWRTLREGVLDFTGALGSLHDLNVRLYAFVDEQYHKSPHASLFGKTPAGVYESHGRKADAFDEARLRAALTVHERRRVRRDSTLSMDGEEWECPLGFLAGRLVTVSRCLVDPTEPPWLEHEGRRFVLERVDPVRNGHRKRSHANLDSPHEAKVPFDPAKALLDRALGRTPSSRQAEEARS